MIAPIHDTAQLRAFLTDPQACAERPMARRMAWIALAQSRGIRVVQCRLPEPCWGGTARDRLAQHRADLRAEAAAKRAAHFGGA
ncbi:hypothetical protein N0B44_15745 [Roseibacterium beibuensis]|uniref:Uncharacterized protein n=1 Tax=[Roseibacterium] beibuensis TaxID=1193142 RepID=A0ABP9LCT3_9RHOB|nr:hypothetical protein [Roseibacterium beibuensis]MCS6624372.1 hypothetical protein [Roseibacterium beibuensis]